MFPKIKFSLSVLAIHSSHVIDLERIRIPLRIEREFLIKLCIFYGDQVRTANGMEKDNYQSDGIKIYELKNIGMVLYYSSKIVIHQNMFIFIFVVLYRKMHQYPEKILDENYSMLYHPIIDR